MVDAAGDPITVLTGCIFAPLRRHCCKRARAFGMKAVLPGFQGNVPLAMHTLYPRANISRVGKPANVLREHYASAAWIDCEDPLFDKLADA